MSIASAKRQKAAKSKSGDDLHEAVNRHIGINFAMVPLSKIDRDGQNHRLNNPDDKKKIRELMDDFASGPEAQLQPVRVYEREDGSYLLGFGFRRCAAAEACNWIHIRAEVLKDPGNRAEIERVRAIENLHRQDLNPMEEAMAVSQLLESMGFAGEEEAKGQAIDQAAAMLGKSPAWVRDRCYLNRLGPKTRNRVIEGTLLLGHAREIAKLGDHAIQENLARMCEVREDGSCQSRLDQVRQWVANHQNSLRAVPWKLDASFEGVKDKRILGACATCPHNSTNDHQLFEHDDAKAQDNFCLNPECYAAKTNLCNKVVEKAVATIVRKELPNNESTAMNVAEAFVRPGRVVREVSKQRNTPGGGAKDVSQTSSAGENEGQQTSNVMEEAKQETSAAVKHAQVLRQWQEDVINQIEEAARKDARRIGHLALLDATDWAQNLFEHDEETIKAGEPLVEAAVSDRPDMGLKLAQVLQQDPRYQCSVILDLPPELLERFAIGWNLKAGKMPRLEDFSEKPASDQRSSPPTDQTLQVGWGATRLTEVLREAEVSFHGLGTIKDERDEPIETLGQLCAMLGRAEASGPIEDLNFKIPGTGLKISRKILTAAQGWFDNHPTATGQPACMGGGPCTMERVIEHHREEATAAIENQPQEEESPDARCRVCGCTEDDCSGCLKRTGEACRWVDDPDENGDLCSACAGFPKQVQHFVRDLPIDVRPYALAAWSYFTSDQQGTHPNLLIPSGRELSEPNRILAILQQIAKTVGLKWKKDKAQTLRDKYWKHLPKTLLEDAFPNMDADAQNLAVAFWAHFTDRDPTPPDPDQFPAHLTKQWGSIRAVVRLAIEKETKAAAKKKGAKS